MASIYVHFPFCRSRCAYCAFYSQTHYDRAEEYVSALKAEARQRANYLNGETVRTIYFGGGTPSSLPIGCLEEVADAIRSTFCCETEEFTVEINPDDVTTKLLLSLQRAGVNRISMGIQTFDDGLLRLIHRRHMANQAVDAYRMIRAAGFSNVSIDLILALPGQTLESSAADIDAAISLHPEHISAYLLEYEEGTELWNKRKNGMIKGIDDELQAEMYYQMCRMFEQNGYEHYEISNFARHDTPHTSMRSLHNSSYWNNTPYIGLGTAAHSYNLKERRWNTSNIDSYIESTLGGATKSEAEALNEVTLYNEMIMTRLRTIEGIRPNDIRRIQPIQAEYLKKAAKNHLYDGLLELTSDHCLRLTRQGLILSDRVMCDLFIDDLT